MTKTDDCWWLFFPISTSLISSVCQSKRGNLYRWFGSFTLHVCIAGFRFRRAEFTTCPSTPTTRCAWPISETCRSTLSRKFLDSMRTQILRRIPMKQLRSGKHLKNWSYPFCLSTAETYFPLLVVTRDDFDPASFDLRWRRGRCGCPSPGTGRRHLPESTRTFWRAGGCCEIPYNVRQLYEHSTQTGMFVNAFETLQPESSDYWGLFAICRNLFALTNLLWSSSEH